MPNDQSTVFFLAAVAAAALLAVVLVLVIWLAERRRDQAKIQQLLEDRDRSLTEARRESVEKSRSSLKGRIAEQLAPLLPGFQYLPADARFLGDPIDYIVFNGYTSVRDEAAGDAALEIVLLEVKQGKSALSTFPAGHREVGRGRAGQVRGLPRVRGWNRGHRDMEAPGEGKARVIRHGRPAGAFLAAGALLVMAAMTLPVGPVPAQSRPGREISLLPAEVKDSFFAYVIGIIRAGIDVELDSTGMREVLTEFKTALDLPFDLITRVWQGQEPEPGQLALGLEFNGGAAIPIPFSLLGYHPGSIRASSSIGFRELRFTYPDARGTGAEAPVYRLQLDQGSLIVDIDWWIDELLGDYLDDLPVSNIVFFTWRGEWTGHAAGPRLPGTTAARLLQLPAKQDHLSHPGGSRCPGPGVHRGSVRRAGAVDWRARRGLRLAREDDHRLRTVPRGPRRCGGEPRAHAWPGTRGGRARRVPHRVPRARAERVPVH